MGTSRIQTKNKTSPQEEESCKSEKKYYSEEEITEAIALFNVGNYVEAIEIFGHYSRQGNILARQYLARCYHRLERYEVAYTHFQYLSEHGDDRFRNYGTSMMAAIEIVWGNYDKAIKVLKSLPPEPRNQISLSLVYWKKYKTQKDESAIREALRLLNTLDLEFLHNELSQTVYHLKGLIYQAQKDYKVAETFYTWALERAGDDVCKAQTLNDFASLFIEIKNYEKAEEFLLRARKYVLGVDELEEAFNNKWMGILAVKRKEYENAKEYLTKAVKVIREKELLREVAGIVFLLAELSRDQGFYKAADYYADGIVLERLLGEVKESDEKIVHFYFNLFFGALDNSSSPS